MDEMTRLRKMHDYYIHKCSKGKWWHEENVMLYENLIREQYRQQQLQEQKKYNKLFKIIKDIRSSGNVFS